MITAAHQSQADPQSEIADCEIGVRMHTWVIGTADLASPHLSATRGVLHGRDNVASTPLFYTHYPCGTVDHGLPLTVAGDCCAHSACSHRTIAAKRVIMDTGLRSISHIYLELDDNPDMNHQ